MDELLYVCSIVKRSNTIRGATLGVPSPCGVHCLISLHFNSELCPDFTKYSYWCFSNALYILFSQWYYCPLTTPYWQLWCRGRYPTVAPQRIPWLTVSPYQCHPISFLLHEVTKTIHRNFLTNTLLYTHIHLQYLKSLCKKYLVTQLLWKAA